MPNISIWVSFWHWSNSVRWSRNFLHMNRITLKKFFWRGRLIISVFILHLTTICVVFGNLFVNKIKYLMIFDNFFYKKKWLLFYDIRNTCFEEQLCNYVRHNFIFIESIAFLQVFRWKDLTWQPAILVVATAVAGIMTFDKLKLLNKAIKSLKFAIKMVGIWHRWLIKLKHSLIVAKHLAEPQFRNWYKHLSCWDKYLSDVNNKTRARCARTTDNIAGP